MGCHFLLQEIFPTQESNPGLLNCRQMIYQLSYEGSPNTQESFAFLYTNKKDQKEKNKYCILMHFWGFSQSSVGKSSACNAADPGLIPGSGRSPGEGNGNPLQYSCLENPMDRGAWWATVHRTSRVRYGLLTKPLPPMHIYGI